MRGGEIGGKLSFADGRKCLEDQCSGWGRGGNATCLLRYLLKPLTLEVGVSGLRR